MVLFPDDWDGLSVLLVLATTLCFVYYDMELVKLKIKGVEFYYTNGGICVDELNMLILGGEVTLILKLLGITALELIESVVFCGDFISLEVFCFFIFYIFYSNIISYNCRFSFISI